MIDQPDDQQHERSIEKDSGFPHPQAA
jgi:hypothetical protein